MAGAVPVGPPMPRPALPPDPRSDARSGLPLPAFGAVARAVAWRPDLWWTALGVLRRLAAPGWWRSRPYLPLPGAALWRFRMVTAYGRPDAVPERADVVSYLEWCRSTAPVRRPGPGPGASAATGDRRDPTRSG
jgi:hypothetical protein